MRIKKDLGEKWQVVIPKDIREFLDLKDRETIVFEIEDNRVELKKEQSPEEYLKDFLDVPKLKKRITAKEIKDIIMEQYDEEIPRR